jgi:hypothetical protein
MNYAQPDFRNPVTPGVSVQVEGRGNPLNINGPTPSATYIQPNLSAKDDPSGNVRNGKSGKGSAG